MRYVDLEYGAPKYAMLRSNLLAMRDCKRLFPVNMYGQQSITHEDDLSLQLQREIKSSLEAAGIHIKVKTDFDTYVEHIGQNPEFWQMLIERSPKLASLAPNIDKLAADLAACDPGVLDKVNTALRENRFDVRMDSKNLVNWIIEVQNKLREGGVYNGLLIVWDEFTEIATSPAIGVKLLERLQEISDTLMSPEHDSYFLLISHPSALNALNEQKRNQTIGRYHYFTYNMEMVSAFKIMSRKFNILDTEAHTKLVDEFYGSHPGLLEIYSATSNQPEETKSDLKKLYPLHPATADLATHYAREAGSSSRSVFEFLASDTVRDFLDNEDNCANERTITCDLLWDYVQEYFESDTTRFGAVTERYNSHHLAVEAAGDNYLKVFKGVPFAALPADTAFGALLSYATDAQTVDYQPSHVNFGLMPPLDTHIRNKKERYAAYAKRGADSLKAYCNELRDAGLLPLSDDLAGEMHMKEQSSHTPDGINANGLQG